MSIEYRVHKTSDTAPSIQSLIRRYTRWIIAPPCLAPNCQCTITIIRKYYTLAEHLRRQWLLARMKTTGHHRHRPPSSLCSIPFFFLFTYMLVGWLLGGVVVWWVGARIFFSRGRRVLWAERLAEKRPHSGPAARGFSKFLTSGIRNELSKGLKLNTCKGESEK